MTKKIFYSIFTVSLIVVLASIVIATSFLYNYFNNSQISKLKEELYLVANIVNKVGIQHFENFNLSSFRFTIINSDGTVLYDTQINSEELENHSEREEIIEAINTGTGSSVRNSSTLTKKTFYEAVLLENGDVLRVSVSQLTVGALMLSMLPAIIFIILITAGVSIILSHTMAKKITHPLLQLDLEHPAKNIVYEELTPLLTKVQKQHKQINSQLETLKHKSDEFDQIISSMNEGLVLLDEHAMILSMNVAAKKIFSVKKEVNGTDFLLLDLTTKMSKAVWNALEGRRSEYIEQKNGKEYQFTVNSIESDSKVLGAVILAFDITDRVFAEHNRQEFTANVTHELKTPLQSIIGSIELLENGLVKPEDTSRFICNIHKEATRLTSLINDIIRISQLDENHEPATEIVKLKEVAEEVVEDLTVSASSKNINLIIEGEPYSIYGVRSYIYEIIYNLCDNAIRYNVNNGKVTIKLGKENGNVTIIVKDTGIGISPEHQNRIFERFYRVDNSHSKETGGTGLGLSIVKHAVQYHGGKIIINSEIGKGTTIKIVF